MFAPLSFLRQTPPNRSPIAHTNPITGPDLDGTESFSIEFTAAPVPEGQPSSIQSLPPSQNGQASFYTPPPHYHLLQDEHFRVLSGSGIWHLSKGRSIRLNAGDTITIPAWQYHWFENAKDSKEHLRVGYWYAREYTEMEEKFFRNTLAYIADCTRAGQQPSVVQLCIFSLHNWMVIGVVNWDFAPDWVNFAVNTLIMTIVALLGKYVLGCAASYEQYWQPQEKSK